MRAADIFERVMTRLFCGRECWEVQYSITDPSGSITGVHRTYLPLSKAKSEVQVKHYGREIAKEVCFTARVLMGITAESVQIHQADRIW